ncbi:hypothetical protein SMUDGE_37 [Bacillus phage Smudge]|uniref:Uncharacterized protein n=3 Tax=Wphvirus megatron TaxID=1987728 RepID=A0A173H2E1_9CAUD|nr:hypothetical protein QLX47_gp042 [Bacillus phage Eyuki]YP_009284982.1 hypothetical protein BIZ88_gp040 [Bacillus phage DirtyBetty]ANI24656.1 hypothetical protein SMUDGE_37 [Bacillus phage Smudge]ASR79253.1 hypothetical protein ZAINNY_40 [Bacillus phage Zainny]QDH49313.1 hypothetical protein PHIREBALL_38 [Bacillus phage Phireball]ULF48951.1 hypothetical protein [Bacillus phage Darren]ALA46600.1 hypothetical protein EYUKI_42 [Bacillus phage Eyuki]
MLQIVDNENNEGTLTITDAGDRLKFKVSDNNTDEQYSIKLGYKKLKKLSDKLTAFLNADESDIEDGTSIIIEKKTKFLEVEISYVDLGFVVGTMDGSRQGDWEVLTVQHHHIESIVKEIDDKLISLEEDTLHV